MEGKSIVQDLYHLTNLYYDQYNQYILRSLFYLYLTVYLAYNIEGEPSFEEAVFLGKQMNKDLSITIEQGIFALYQFIHKESPL